MKMWSALERLSNLLGTTADWQDKLGNEFAVIQRKYLRPTDRIAQTYPCPKLNSEYCPRGIIKHGSDDFAAYCRQSPKQCDTLNLKKADVILYEFHLEKLALELADILELNPINKITIHKPTRPIKLGDQQLASSKTIPVFFQINALFLDLNVVIQNLYVESSSPVIVLSTSLKGLKDRWIGAWRSSGIAVLAISNLVSRPVGSNWIGMMSLVDAYDKALKSQTISVPDVGKGDLVVNRTTREAKLYGHRLELQPRDFDVLVIMAIKAKAGSNRVDKEVLFKAAVGASDSDDIEVNPNVLDKRIHNIRTAFRAAVKDKAENALEILKTYSKHGCGLTISEEEIVIIE